MNFKYTKKQAHLHPYIHTNKIKQLINLILFCMIIIMVNKA